MLAFSLPWQKSYTVRTIEINIAKGPFIGPQNCYVLEILSHYIQASVTTRYSYYSPTKLHTHRSKSGNISFFAFYWIIFLDENKSGFWSFQIFLTAKIFINK